MSPIASSSTGTVAERGWGHSYVDISMTGSLDLQRRLMKLSMDMQKSIVQEALLAAAVPIVQETKRLCPVRTGKLRDGIRAYLKRAKHYPAVEVRTPTRSQLGIPGDSKWYYPAILEYGAWNRSKTQEVSYRDARGRRRTTMKPLTERIRAYRYMRDGLKEGADAAISIMAARIKAAVDQAGVT